MLRVFHGAAVGGGIEAHAFIAEHLVQVVIEIPGLFLVVEHEEERTLHRAPMGKGGEGDGCGRGMQPLAVRQHGLPVLQNFGKGGNAGMGGVER